MKLAIEHRASPNHGERAPGKPVDMIILHYTGMPSAERAVSWLCDPESGVSSHYVVCEDGRVIQLVDESRRAWHAGKSFWAGETDINSRSIGIEIANPGHEFGYRPFPDRQIAAVIALCHDILLRHIVPPQHVLAHSDVAPFRKIDPGELFPWPALHAAGIGHWVSPEPLSEGPSLKLGERGAAVNALRAALRTYGYDLARGEDYDAATETIVSAFQRHFRPDRVDGVADPSTVATLRRLAGALRRK
jgi:N-acetylmuramoyl-L-alanine amidase